MPVPLTLCDRSPQVVDAWRRYFPDDIGVRIVNQNILTIDTDALALPANSFGFTDGGGVDLSISREVFDWRLQETLREIVMKQYHGELLVGQAVVQPTGSEKLRYVVITPTMRVPTDVSNTVNAYLAMRGILLAVDEFNRAARVHASDRIRSLAIPGLCTGTGKMPADRSAYQMYNAYTSVVLNDLEWTGSISSQADHDKKMRER